MESEIKSVYPLPLPTILLMNWAIYFAEHLSENAAIVGLGMPASFMIGTKKRGRRMTLA
jgi:hypothetical protein